jgi:hypothetical protein
MKTIITQDKANKSFGYPQLDSNKKINVDNIPTDIIATTGSNLFVGNQSINGSLNIKSVIENVIYKNGEPKGSYEILENGQYKITMC